MDVADYYDHDERELNCMIHSNEPVGGDNIDQQRDGEDGGGRRGSDGEDRDSGWREGDERRQDGDGRQDGDRGDWHQERELGRIRGAGQL